MRVLGSPGGLAGAWRWWSGPAVYLVFVALMVAVEYARPLEFRSPPRCDVLVPYLLLFFASIMLMGAPMFRAERRLWLVTAASPVLLFVSMSVAMGRKVSGEQSDGRGTYGASGGG